MKKIIVVCLLSFLSILLAKNQCLSVVITDDNISVYDKLPKNTQGKNGIRLQFRSLHSNEYTDLKYNKDYSWITANVPNVPEIGRYGQDVIWAHPSAVNQCLYNRDSIIRVQIENDAEELIISGKTVTGSSTSLTFYIYKGEGGYNNPIWIGGPGEQFNITTEISVNEEIFFAVSAGSNDINDWAKWKDLLLQKKGKSYTSFQNFENGLNDWTYRKTKDIIPSIITDERSYSGEYSFAVGPSNCGANCWSKNMVILSYEFDKKNYINNIEFLLSEKGNWGGVAYIMIDDEYLTDTFPPPHKVFPRYYDPGTFDPVPNNHPETAEWFKFSDSINRYAKKISVVLYDLTHETILYIDDISINNSMPVAQSPMSGPPGTIFTQWGTGFTPNSSATLHFQKPDGTEYPTQSINLDDEGHFEIEYTAPHDKPAGIYTWWAVDDTTGKKSNEVTYTITKEISPTIAQTPMSGPHGTTFKQWGTGFSPGGNATLHFEKIDGPEYSTQKIHLDDIGHFEVEYTIQEDKSVGEYIWWAVDDTTHIKSNEVFYRVNENQKILAGNYNFANIGKKANQFQVWVDISIDGENPGANLLSKYTFSIEVEEGATVNQTNYEQISSRTYIGEGDLGPSSGRYRISFEIAEGEDPENPTAAYFENGTIYIKGQATQGTKLILPDAPKNFSVYGSNFDITKHAWQFANGEWQVADDKLIWSNEIFEGGNIIEENHIKKSYHKDFWESFGLAHANTPRFWGKIEGGCYGLVNSAIANFAHQNKTESWGTGSLDNWNKDINNHWVEDSVQKPYKPFSVNDIYHSGQTWDEKTKWTSQSARKIMYYHITNSSWKKKGISDWVGEDNITGERLTSFTKKFVFNILKKGRPVSTGIQYIQSEEKINHVFNADKEVTDLDHQVAIVQCITYDGNDKYIIWDNNYPYSNKKR